MKNFINWFEIPASDLSRAQQFYQNILGVVCQETEMYGIKMAMLPNDGTIVSGAIVQGQDYKPTKDGALVYLNANPDLQPILNAIEKNNGIIIVPKTQISAEMGYFALFIDTEGNKIGLHSNQ